jgi:hypothetical protein
VKYIHNLRQPTERYTATRMANAILRGDRKRQHAQAMPRPDKKKESPVENGPRRLHLSDLKTALAHRRRLQGDRQ